MADTNVVKRIGFHTMADEGFLGRLRSNTVDETAYIELLAAIGKAKAQCSGSQQIDRLLVALLFAVPYEVENTVPHYAEQSAVTGARVNVMSEELATAINDLLWDGLDPEQDW